MSGDPAIKDRMEKAIAESGYQGRAFVNYDLRCSPEIGWVVDIDRLPPVEAARLCWRVFMVAGVTVSCERCYLDSHVSRRIGAITTCKAGDCVYGNLPGAFDRSAPSPRSLDAS